MTEVEHKADSQIEPTVFETKVALTLVKMIYEETMEPFMPKILDLIALLGVLTIIAVVLIAVIRPEQLPTIAALVKGIVYVLLRRDIEVEVRTKQKHKNNDDQAPKN